MKQQTHQCPFWTVSWFQLKIWKWEGSMQWYWLQRPNTLENGMNWIFLTRRMQCFFYKIIIHPHEATDSSVFSGACFHDCILISENEMVVCIVLDTKFKHIIKIINCFLLTRSLLSVFGTRFLCILMKKQTHWCPLGPVFMITS